MGRWVILLEGGVEGGGGRMAWFYFFSFGFSLSVCCFVAVVFLVGLVGWLVYFVLFTLVGWLFLSFPSR